MIAPLRTDLLLLAILIVLLLQWYDQSGIRVRWADFRRMWPKRRLRALQWWRRVRAHMSDRR